MQNSWQIFKQNRFIAAKELSVEYTGSLLHIFIFLCYQHR